MQNKKIYACVLFACCVFVFYKNFNLILASENLNGQINIYSIVINFLSVMISLGGAIWLLLGLIRLAGALKDSNNPELQHAVWQIVGGFAIMIAVFYFKTTDISLLLLAKLLLIAKKIIIFGGALWFLYGLIILAGALKNDNHPALESSIWQMVGGMIIMCIIMPANVSIVYPTPPPTTPPPTPTPTPIPKPKRFTKFHFENHGGLNVKCFYYFYDSSGNRLGNGDTGSKPVGSSYDCNAPSGTVKIYCETGGYTPVWVHASPYDHTFENPSKESTTANVIIPSGTTTFSFNNDGQLQYSTS